jgi:putative adhesin
MKFNSSIINLLLASLLLCGASAQAQTAAGKGEGQGQGAGQGIGQGKGESVQQQGGEAVAMATTTNTVYVSVTTGAGSIVVHGWDKSEVRAQVRQPGSKIEMRKTSEPTEAANAPASRVEIMVSDKSEEDEDDEVNPDTCNSASDVMVDVPRGATLYLKTQEGDIEVDNVAEAHVETTDGRIEARRISRVTDATSVGGDMTLEDASGRARLNSLGGVIEVRDLRQLNGGDFLTIRTVSGDILLDKIGPARVEAVTISGELRLIGPLARNGAYDFTTTNGDVTIMLPADSSFKLNAKVSESGEISTDFPLTYKGSGSPTTPLQAGRVSGQHGSGDATIRLVSFSGTLRLKKQ